MNSRNKLKAFFSLIFLKQKHPQTPTRLAQHRKCLKYQNFWNNETKISARLATRKMQIFGNEF
jgi:hypothetical protein